MKSFKEYVSEERVDEAKNRWDFKLSVNPQFFTTNKNDSEFRIYSTTRGHFRFTFFPESDKDVKLADGFAKKYLNKKDANGYHYVIPVAKTYVADELKLVCKSFGVSFPDKEWSKFLPAMFELGR